MIPFCSEKIKIKKSNIGSKLLFNIVTYTSLFTYAIYLIHPLVFPYFISKNPFTELKIVNFLIANGVTYILAAIVYYGYESKWLKIRDKFYARKA